MFKKNARIITKMGDIGMTTLADGRKIAKSNSLIDALGNVDELNSLIGILLSDDLPKEIQKELICIQNDLFDLGGELAGSSKSVITEKQLLRLENQATKLDAGLLPLQGLILPGGSRQGALFHYVRSVCRRAERSVFTLAETENISATIGKYLNRLSDVLFIYARVMNRNADKPDLLWQKQ